MNVPHEESWYSLPTSSWRRHRVRDEFVLVNGFPFPSDGFNVDGDGLPLVRIRDLLGARLETFFNGDVGLDVTVKRGDIVIGMDGDFNTVWWDRDEALLNQRVCALRPRVGSRLLPRFAFYQISTPLKIINDLTPWSTVKHLSSLDVLSLRLPAPDLDTQKTIADFLDRETARIDQLIEKKERLVVLLSQSFDQTVRQVVTKGSPCAMHPLVDSRVNYLGEVPQHWSVERTGWRYTVQLGKMLDSAKQTGEHERPYLRVADVQWDTINTDDLPVMDFTPSDRKRYALVSGDLLVNEGGSYVGRSAIWEEKTECYYQKALHRLRPLREDRDTSEFFLWVMWFATKNGVFVANGNQTTIDHLTAEALRRYRFAFPPHDEQLDLARYLRSEKKRSHQTAEVVALSVSRLREFRSALITAAVTGQIDVTTWGKQGSTDHRLDQIEEEMSA